VTEQHPRIEVVGRGDEGFSVRVEDDASARDYDVTVPESLVQECGASAEHLVEESFRFLLKREPKESILQNFWLPVIERCFPEYPLEIRRRLQLT
jgi:hypothetical protein